MTASTGAYQYSTQQPPSPPGICPPPSPFPSLAPSSSTSLLSPSPLLGPSSSSSLSSSLTSPQTFSGFPLPRFCSLACRDQDQRSHSYEYGRLPVTSCLPQLSSLLLQALGSRAARGARPSG
eukprot:768706-Hanusia_phi.AAC.2